jgi:hypothetical protein
LFGLYWLLGLEDATEQYGVRRSIGYFEKQESFWFPVLQDDANYYLFDTARTNGNVCPIIESANLDEPHVAFVSLEAMFDTMYYWVEVGSWRLSQVT